MSIGRVLIIEDSPSLARTYEAQLKRDAAAIEIAEDGAAGERAMGAGRPEDVWNWAQFMAGFDVLFLFLSAWLFERLLTEG